MWLLFDQAWKHKKATKPEDKKQQVGRFHITVNQ